MQYYIAFSVHGTNAFISATSKSVDLTSGSGFTIGKSRRGCVATDRPFDSVNETKILWDKLNYKDGRGPHINPSHILKLFKRLERMGWKIHDYKFRHHHYGT